MSMSRYCEFWKATTGQWFIDLAHHEYGEYEDSSTYGPFSSEESADKYLRDNFSNPGSSSSDDSGTKPPPTSSPNGDRVQKPNGGYYTPPSTQSRAPSYRDFENDKPVASVAPPAPSKQNPRVIPWSGKFAIGFRVPNDSESLLWNGTGFKNSRIIREPKLFDSFNEAEQFVTSHILDFIKNDRADQVDLVRGWNTAPVQQSQQPGSKVYKIYGTHHDANLGSSKLHTRVKGKIYAPTKDSKFKKGQKANVSVDDTGATLTDPSSNHTQRWSKKESRHISLGQLRTLILEVIKNG